MTKYRKEVSCMTISDEPIYKNSYVGFWINVYSNRIEFRAGATVQSMALNQIASVEEGSWGFNKITIETTGGKKYSLPTSKKKEVREAILDAQSKFSTSGNSSRSSEADEILKLNELKEKGIITEEEFKQKKKQLLGI